MGRDTSAYMHHEQNGIPEYPMQIAIPHNIAAAATHSPEFWPQNFPFNAAAAFNPAWLHQNLQLLPAYKNPHISAFLSQYMGLGIFNYPQNLAIGSRISPPMLNSSPKESPPLHETDK